MLRALIHRNSLCCLIIKHLMVQSLSSEGNSHSLGQEILCLWNLKFHHCIHNLCLKYWQFLALMEPEGFLLFPPFVTPSTDNSLSLQNMKANYSIHHLCLKVLTIPWYYGTRRLITVSTICVSKYWQFLVLTEPEGSLLYPPFVSQSTDNSLTLRNPETHYCIHHLCLKVLTIPCPYGTWRLITVSTICVSK
jgi:hypothetical protein